MLPKFNTANAIVQKERTTEQEVLPDQNFEK